MNNFISIIKNKYLFNEILNHSKYDRPNLISVHSILNENNNNNNNNNNIELLKFKIMNNKYLIFDNNNNNNKENKEYIELIIKTFKNENQSFFKSLFLNYSLYFSTTSNNDNDELNQLIEIIISNKSKSALKVLIKHFNLKLNIKSFQITLNYNSSKEIIDLIISNLESKEIDEIKLNLIKSWKTDINDQFNFKLFYHLISKFNLLENNNNPNGDQDGEINEFDEFIEYSAIKSNIINIPSHYKEPYRSSLKLGQLISACKCIVYIDQNNSIQSSQPSPPLKIDELIKIKSKFSKLELKSSLPNLFLNQIYRENESIKRIYKYYLNYNKSDCLIYSIIYDIDETYNFCSNYKSIEYFFKLCLNFANYKYLNQFYDKRTIEKLIGELYQDEEDDDDKKEIKKSLFLNCNSNSAIDKEKQIKFILNIQYFDPLVLFYLLIQYDDLELLSKYVEMKQNENGGGLFVPRKTGYSDNFPFTTFSFINSIKMLDYLYANFKNHLIDPITSKPYRLYQRGRIDLLEKFHQLLLSDNSINQDLVLINKLFPKIENSTINKIPLKVINFMVNYKLVNGFYDSKFSFSNLGKWLIQVKSNDDLEEIKLLINKLPPITQSAYKYNITLISNLKLQIKLFNWIYEYRNDDIYKTGKCRISIVWLCNYLFLTNRFDELFKIQVFLNKINGIEFTFQDCNISYLEYQQQQLQQQQQQQQQDNQLNLIGDNAITTSNDYEVNLIVNSVGRLDLEDDGIEFLQRLIKHYSPLLENDSNLSKSPKVQTFLFNVLQGYAKNGRISIFFFLNSNYPKILSEWLLNINLNIIHHKYLKNYLSKI